MEHVSDNEQYFRNNCALDHTMCTPLFRKPTKPTFFQLIGSLKNYLVDIVYDLRTKVLVSIYEFNNVDCVSNITKISDLILKECPSYYVPL